MRVELHFPAFVPELNEEVLTVLEQRDMIHAYETAKEMFGDVSVIHVSGRPGGTFMFAHRLMQGSEQVAAIVARDDQTN